MTMMVIHKFTAKLLIVSITWLCIGCAFIEQIVLANRNDDGQLTSQFCHHLGILIFCAFLSIAISLPFIHVALFLPVSDRHTSIVDVMKHYGWLWYYKFAAKNYWLRFCKASKNVKSNQEQTLMRILSDNNCTEYGKLMKFNEINNVDGFVKTHPIDGYERFRPYVDRMLKGERNLITSRDIGIYCLSSGTTGKRKHIPGVLQSVIDRMEGSFPWNFCPYIFPASPNLAPVKSVGICNSPKWDYTDDGVPIGIASVYPPTFKRYDLALARTTPPEVSVHMPEEAQIYVHWLFALSDRNLVRIDAVYAGSLGVMIDFMVKHLSMLSEDIKKGKIDKSRAQFGIPIDIAEKIELLLAPNEERGHEIDQVIKSGSKGICKRLWPNLQMSYALSTGSHQVYKNRLKYLLGPGVELFTNGYHSSEFGCAAINLNHPYVREICGYQTPVDDDKEYMTLIPNGGCFYEFKRIDEENDQQTYLMHELELGKRYDVIITTDTCGFYRYPMGDIVKVVGFFNQLPIVEICARTAGMLDIRGEKTTEDMVYNALEKSMTKFGWKLTEFTSTDSVIFRSACEDSDQGMYYVVFVEIDGINRKLNESEIEAFDQALRGEAVLYDCNRQHAVFKQGKFISLKAGSFEALKKWTLTKTGAVSNQYKTPKFLKSEDSINFLLESAYAK